MNLEEFCVRLAPLDMSQTERGLAVLWFVDRENPGAILTSGEIARTLRDAGLGHPHSTKLGEAIFKTKNVLKNSKGLRIKPASRAEVERKVASVLTPALPEADQENGYLPKAVWSGTRSYVEKIAKQINGCYEFGFYDGASVLSRRLVETLLIDTFEKAKKASDIKDGNGNYKMLSHIIKAAVDGGKLTLGRETKRAVNQIKTLGDRSAHNPRYIATKSDLDAIRNDLRVAADELLHLSGMK